MNPMTAPGRITDEKPTYRYLSRLSVEFALPLPAPMMNVCLANPILYCCFENVDFYVC